MSEYMGDLGSFYASNIGSGVNGVQIKKPSDNNLDMNDFLMLMVSQFQNQSMDNTASTSDMLNQLVQMSVVQAITNITDATVMMYSGSLVGKEVTVGEFVNGELKEIVGTVTGTGVAGGQQVIFVDGKSYYLSDIMAVGKLPEIEKPDEGGEEGEGGKDETDGLHPEHPIVPPATDTEKPEDETPPGSEGTGDPT